MLAYWFLWPSVSMAPKEVEFSPFSGPSLCSFMLGFGAKDLANNEILFLGCFAPVVHTAPSIPKQREGATGPRLNSDISG